MSVTKARYWWGVLYPENMVDDWQNYIGDLLQLPFAYCIHDADHNIDGEDRKTHIHLIIVFPNTTTYNHAMKVFDLLSAHGKKALNKIEACISIRYCYDYLIHDTENAHKAGKHVYSPDQRICGNNFDIGSYEQIGQEEKNEKLRDMLDFVIANEIPDLATFMLAYDKQLVDPVIFDVFKSYGSLIERVCKGVHLRNLRSLSKS